MLNERRRLLVSEFLDVMYDKLSSLPDDFEITSIGTGCENGDYSYVIFTKPSDSNEEVLIEIPMYKKCGEQDDKYIN